MATPDPVAQALEKAAKRARRTADLDGGRQDPGLGPAERREHNRTVSETPFMPFSHRSVDQAFKKLRKGDGIFGTLAACLSQSCLLRRH